MWRVYSRHSRQDHRQGRAGPPGLFAPRAQWAGGVGGGFFDRAPVGVARFFENFTESQTKKSNSDFNGFKGNSGIIENSVALPVLCYIRRTIIASSQI